MSYNGALSMVFRMQLYFQNPGINSTQNSSVSQVYKVVVWFSKENARLEIERLVL